MNTPFLPSDATSLLVPLHLEAWVVDSWTKNSVPRARYTANYGNLKEFKSPVPAPFDLPPEDLDDGVHLHWALPDALTHGRREPDGPGFEFPTVPNRWLIARFSGEGGVWTTKVWVVRSDNLEPISMGKTASELTNQSTSLTIAAPGLACPVGAGAKLALYPPGGGDEQTVTIKTAAKQGATKIDIVKIPSLSDSVPSGSSLVLPTTSAFLDPFKASSAKVDAAAGKTDITLNEKPIGTPYSIEAWEAQTDTATDELFLTAIGPGNATFAAFAPFVENVFSFVDRDLPPETANGQKYSYMVTGWYSDQNADPLQTTKSFDNSPAIWQDAWASKSVWENQTPAERFATIVNYLKWSVSSTNNPVDSSLYQAVIPGVIWAYDPANEDPPNYPKNVSVAVGNTSVDALSALVINDKTITADDPTRKKLADLLEAARYDLLKDYGKPGGRALIEQKIHQAWYGSTPGGILWEAVGTTPDAAGQDAVPPELTDAQKTQLGKVLAVLNTAQRASDKAKRELASLQSDLYTMWWESGMAYQPHDFVHHYDPGTLYPKEDTPQWADLKPELGKRLYPKAFGNAWTKYCEIEAALAQLPDPTDAERAQQWADSNPKWKFPGTPTKKDPDPPEVNLSGLGLRLKSAPMPRFWHPNDPVVLIRGLNRSQKHGEDGRDAEDDKLACRLPDETIIGLKITDQPTIDVATMLSNGVNILPSVSMTKVPAATNLIYEAFFVDPASAPIIAKAVKGDEQKIEAAIKAQTSWAGTPPVSFAIASWEQPWSPLFLEWELHYFPTGDGQARDRRFTLDDWHFDGAGYHWKGTEAVTDTNSGVEKGSGYDPDYYVSFVGRTFVTPQTPSTLKKKIKAYLVKNPKIDSAALDSLLKTIGAWDLLSQSISGFTDRLLTLKTEETFPPPPSDPNEKIECPKGNTKPSVTALIGDQYRSVPILIAPEDPDFGGSRNHFYPVRGGFIQFQTLQVVDTYGQKFEIPVDSVSTPIPAQGLAPDSPETIPPPATLQPLPDGAIQLPPRIVQPSRLDFRFLSSDGSGVDTEVSPNPDAVCGWLIPNHLDGGIAVYDEAGQALGELFALPAPDNWRPRPGGNGSNPTPKTITEIKNPVLKDVVSSISAASQPPNLLVFGDVLRTIDETLWMVDPLGGRKDHMLSVLIGRPLAVVQARLQFRLDGNPAFNQLWQKMLKPKNYVKGQDAKPPWVREKDTGIIEDISFPVRLGNLELRNDGLIGYYLTSGSDSYKSFYSVHYSAETTAGDKYIKQIRTPDDQSKSGWKYQGDIAINFQGDPVTVTMLMDPRGCIHASTGILPTTSAALPAHRTEEFLKKLAVTFRVGPIIADPGTLRTPKPAEDHGSWSWIERSTPTEWKEEPIVNADDRARMPDDRMRLREGWLKFAESENSNNKSNSAAPVSKEED